MKKISSIAELQSSIHLLEIKQANDEALLKAQFKTTEEILKPINLIKNTLNELTDLSDSKENFVEESLSLVAGYFSKRIIIENTQNPIKQILGSMIQMGVTSIISKNADSIKAVASDFINHILNKKDNPS